MQAKGWLERRADPKDRRINRLHLTTEGKRIHTAIWPVAEATVDTAMAGLSGEERKTLTALMTRVKLRLQALSENDPGEPEDNLRKPKAEARVL
jgi:DNA-binding MarR family transcriptional regulator